MARAATLTLTIPSPCREDWQQMTPCAQGRYCEHCQHEVIDFRAWSDEALFRFFRQEQNAVCGRLQESQLNRVIALPSQKATLLYRLALAMGLTLVMMQATETYARPKPPLVAYNLIAELENTTPADTVSGTITGTVLDEKKQPMEGVAVIARAGGIIKYGTITDEQGRYYIRLDTPNIKKDLTVEFRYSGYTHQDINGTNTEALRQVHMKEASYDIMGLMIINVTAPPSRLNKIDVIDPKRFGY